MRRFPTLFVLFVAGCKSEQPPAPLLTEAPFKPCCGDVSIRCPGLSVTSPTGRCMTSPSLSAMGDSSAPLTPCSRPHPCKVATLDLGPKKEQHMKERQAASELGLSALPKG
jgi:hypothetical protein